MNERTLDIYQTHKPPKWINKRNHLSSATMLLVMHWVDELGEKEFYLTLEKALKRCHAESFWRDTVLGLEAMIRKTKTHIVELAEKYDHLGGKPTLKTGVRELTTFSNEELQRKLRGEA